MNKKVGTRHGNPESFEASVNATTSAAADEREEVLRVASLIIEHGTALREDEEAREKVEAKEKVKDLKSRIREDEELIEETRHQGQEEARQAREEGGQAA